MKPATKAKFIATIGAWLVKALCSTLRFRVHDPAGFLKLPPTVRMTGIFWHNRLFIIPWFFTRYMCPRVASALTSASKDGEILAAFLGRFGIGAVRGSSSRRGSTAMRELLRTIAEGHDIAITPDGPRGPRYQMNPGVLMLAQKAGVPVLPIRVRYSRYWQFKSWDRFQVPKPFARVDVTLLPLENVAATDDEAAFEVERARLEAILRAEQN